MKSLDLIFTEETAVGVAEKILSATRDKIKEQIANKLYEETEGWLHETYSNYKDKVVKELIGEITEQYVSNPSDYKFNGLRRKIWEENKDEIMKSLTDEAITEGMENVLQQYTHRDYLFNWKWKDGIVNVILSNWDKFKDDERVAQQFGREIDRLKSNIQSLQNKISEIENTVNNE